MKIVLVNHTSDWSGGEAALMRLIAALSPEHECVVACPAEGTLPERLDEYGIERAVLPDVDLSLRVHPVQTPIGIAQVAAAGVALRRAAREHGADLVHANSVRAGLIGAAADRLGSPPIVVQVHDDLPYSTAGRLTRSAIARTAAGIVAVSDYTAATFNRGLRFPRAERVYISIDHERLDPDRVRATDVRAELGLAPDARLIGQVAQITPWKGQDTAIRMLADVRRRHPDTHLLLVGSITFETKATRYDNRSYFTELQALVAELGLGSHVHFLGQRDDVPGLLAAFDFSVLPSWDEPFGMAAAESMAMRTPIFVGSVGGISEYVDDGVSGRVLPPREATAWAQAAIAALDDPDTTRRWGAVARDRVLAFNDEAYGRDIGASYERAIARWHARERKRGSNGH
jgi:glycosyltransferase involved in cell wall biosynthesis